MPAFVDTNILVYAEDRDAGSKHTIARDLVTELWHSGEGVLSIQVLQEFYCLSRDRGARLYGAPQDRWGNSAIQP